jgi:hypothetical protein
MAMPAKHRQAQKTALAGMRWICDSEAIGRGSAA